jgi:hypothetical protein
MYVWRIGRCNIAEFLTDSLSFFKKLTNKIIGENEKSKE